MRVIIVLASAILAFASLVHAAPRPYSFELNARRDRDASGHNKGDDKLASTATVTVFTTSPEGADTSTTSTGSTVTVFATNPSATNSATLPANTVGTVSDLIASLDLLSSLKNSDLTLPSNSIVGNVGKTNIQEPDPGVINVNGGSTSTTTGGNGGISLNGVDANGGDAFGSSSGFTGDFNHFVNGNEISGGEFNGSTIDASNPAP
ncbi:hypothetical protein ACEPAG_4396 [Sanghuangporus baumii]